MHDAKLQIGRHSINKQVFTANIVDNVLLGLYIMQKYKFKLDHQGNAVTIDDNMIPLYKLSNQTNNYSRLEGKQLSNNRLNLQVQAKAEMADDDILATYTHLKGTECLDHAANVFNV